MVLLLGTFVVLLIAAGGAYLVVGAQGGGGSGGANAQGDAPPEQGEAGERPGDGKPGGAQDDNSPGTPGTGAGGKDFVGEWQSGGGETLTIGGAERSGKAAGKSAVSYDRPGRLSTCTGVGEPRKSGKTFRLALKCPNGKARSDLGGDAVLSGQKLTVEWDGGSRQTFAGKGD
ncbi:hypothetical protein H181DRAFT_04803 [Streptomyces sp. WMMB 714]|uniref:hypothetical protein n=1 Tax=Streptomyces sp. WMMB 714 TaxID=1286822 RepID=UPI0005F7F89A|nr:hypothetical protein [Streptomyces sp. WMMB 714]SCK52791.1 hypothetical protein H181DRAFT_04803 [Streptomyces sp. WMMB 714]